MGMKRSHWMMLAAAALVTVLLFLAPRTPEGQGEKNAASARVSEDPASGSTPKAEGPAAGMVSSNPKVSAILNELAAGGPPMQVILKLKDLADQEPENVEAQYHLGLFSWQTNQYDKAMDRFRKVIALDAKGYPDAYAYLGQAYGTWTARTRPSRPFGDLQDPGDGHRPDQRGGAVHHRDQERKKH
jgi:tetratricopeptide (TPR) repeat protein